MAAVQSPQTINQAGLAQPVWTPGHPYVAFVVKYGLSCTAATFAETGKFSFFLSFIV